jgi:hypothetical protein
MAPIFTTPQSISSLSVSLTHRKAALVAGTPA